MKLEKEAEFRPKIIVFIVFITITGYITYRPYYAMS